MFKILKKLFSFFKTKKSMLDIPLSYHDSCSKTFNLTELEQRNYTPYCNDNISTIFLEEMEEI